MWISLSKVYKTISTITITLHYIKIYLFYLNDPRATYITFINSQYLYCSHKDLLLINHKQWVQVLHCDIPLLALEITDFAPSCECGFVKTRESPEQAGQRTTTSQNSQYLSPNRSFYGNSSAAVVSMTDGLTTVESIPVFSPATVSDSSQCSQPLAGALARPTYTIHQ